MYMVGSLSPVA